VAFSQDVCREYDRVRHLCRFAVVGARVFPSRAQELVVLLLAEENLAVFRAAGAFSVRRMPLGSTRSQSLVSGGRGQRQPVPC